MVDVITYARSGYPFKNNGVTVGVYNTIDTTTYGRNLTSPVSGINSDEADVLDDRFDDPRYYTGDNA